MQTVPADIAAAIDAYADAHHAVIVVQHGSTEFLHRLETREAARLSLDAAILKHLRNADEIVQEDDGA